MTVAIRHVRAQTNALNRKYAQFGSLRIFYLFLYLFILFYLFFFFVELVTEINLLDFIKYLQWYPNKGEFKEELTTGWLEKNGKSKQSRRHGIERPAE